MPPFDTTTVVQLARLVGLADMPAILGVRDPEDFAADPCFGLGERPRRIAAEVVP